MNERIKRLTAREIRQLLSSPYTTYHTPLFSLSYVQNNEHTDGPRIACVVSRRVAKTAAERNTIQRRCREAARLHARVLPASFSGILRAKPPITTATFSEYKAAISDLFARVVRS